MKFLVVVGVTLFACVNAMDQAMIDEMKAEMGKKMATCAAEVHASADDIAILTSHAVPASHEGKCVMFCMHKIFNMQNEDGSVNLDGGLASLEMLKDIDAELHGKLVNIFKNCASVAVDSDPCITAANWGECAIKEGKAVGLEKCIFQ